MTDNIIKSAIGNAQCQSSNIVQVSDGRDERREPRLGGGER
jgi:hypothetical protein